MAQKKITELQLRDEVENDLSIPSDDGIQSYRVTASQIFDYIMEKMVTGTSGLAQQVIKPLGAVPIWSFPNAVQTTENDTYAIHASNDEIVFFDASSAGFTATLPTAASVAGKTYTLKKTDSSFNKVTIDTTSAQTIDGDATTTLATQGETLKVVSDGTNWQILERRIPSKVISYTPTGGWTGSVTYTGRYKRVGDCLEVWAYVVASGTPTGSTFSLNLPSGLEIDTTKIMSTTTANTVVGNASFRDGSGIQAGELPGIVCYNSTTSVVCRVLDNDEGADNYAGTMTATFPVSVVSTDIVKLTFKVPIDGWAA